MPASRTMLKRTALIVGLAAFGLALGGAMIWPARGAEPAAAAPWPVCVHGARKRGTDATCAVDGDTFWIHGEKIRIAGVDAPECDPACAGDPSTLALARLLGAGSIVIERLGPDGLGRTLADVSVNGRDIGRALIAVGLAEEWTR